MANSARNRFMLSFATCLLVLAAPAAAQEYPTKEITLVVHSSAGGGTDLTARAIADTLTKENIVSQPIIVDNKTGGSGAVAIKFMAETAVGNPYILWNNTATVALIQSRRANLPYTFRDFTPIAMLAKDPGVVAVAAGSPYKNLTELVAAAKAEPKKIRIGISALGGAGHIIAGMLAKTTGSEFSYVSFKSGGEAASALLGGHVDLICENPNEMLSLVESGKIRLIAATTEERLPDFKDVPTAKEQGVDLVFELGRFFFGPKDIDQAVVTYWEDALERMTKTDRWQKIVAENQMVPAFMTGQAFRQYLEAQSAPMIDTLINLGVIKN
jgi:putative tricarboxylic transport membrane protein